jgi:hypothetical protein
VRRPAAVLVAASIYALLLAGAIANAARYVAAGRSDQVAISLFASLLDGIGLYGTLRARKWGRVLNVVYFGGMAALGSIALAIIAVRGQSAARHWLFGLILALFAYIAATMLQRRVKSYFAGQPSAGASGGWPA